MKIALIGAQGVGKTTLSKKLMETFASSYIVKETVRECPYPCDQAADFKTEWWVLSHSILEEKEAEEAGHSLVIADRCLLDIAVYTKLIHATADGRISDGKRAMIDQTISNWLTESPYDFMFFIKVDPVVWKSRDLDDGFRSTDIGWYNVLTEQFEKVILEHQVSSKTHLEVITNNGKIDEAFQTICNRILDSKNGSHLKRYPGRTLSL
jgi:broad-specificity NMP kinase